MKTKNTRVKSASGNILAVFAAAAAMAGSAFGDPDATLLDTDTYQGDRWSASKLWSGGVFASGNGVVIDTGTGSPEVRMDETNRVVGAFTTTRGTMPATKGDFIISIENTGFEHTFDFMPPRVGKNTGFILSTNTLTFANNGSAAQIRIDDGTGGGDGTARQPYRHFYDVPVVLEDDLEIRHLFDSTNAYGHFSIGRGAGPAAGVVFARSISGDGKGINIKNAASLMGVMFAADNTFSGDLVVDRGLARAIDTHNRPRAGTPFGVGNSVVATNDNSGIDLGGFATGEGQTLVLKGCRYGIKKSSGTETYTNGVLFSSYGRPYKAAEWRGDVVLKGDTWLGGTIANTGSPANLYPADAEGDIVVSGPIFESGGAAAIHTASSRSIVLSGTNTFSGGLWLDKGWFTAKTPDSFGTGRIIFNGGIYRMTDAGDANVLEADVTAAPGELRLHVDAGVTNIVPADSTVFGKSDFYKYGEGALLLTNRISIAGDSKKRGYLLGGTVVFDTSNAQYVKFGPNDNRSDMDLVFVCHNTKMVVRGDPSLQRYGSWYGALAGATAATFRAEDNQVFNIAFTGLDNGVAFANFETDGSGAYIRTSVSDKGHAYWGDWPVLIYEGSSFVTIDAGQNNKIVPLPDSSYSTVWGGATDCVDVTSALAAANVPDGTSADVLRFNTPNGGSELVLTLKGDLTVAGGTLLVTPAMGSTAVRIAGGRILANSVLRILNFNTNATLTIESDIAASSGDMQIATGGPGTTVLSGAKSFNRNVTVLGGELVANCADALGTGNKASYVDIHDGAVLSLDGTFNPASGSSRSDINIRVMQGVGAIKVPDAADTVTLTKGVKLMGGAHFRKLGSGTLELGAASLFVREDYYGVNPNVMHVEYCEGNVVESYKFSENTEFTLADNGVVLKGGRWLTGYQGGENGGGNRIELNSKRVLNVGSGGATVDVQGATVQMNDTRYYCEFDMCPEFLCGDGELTVVDTVGGATLNPNGYRDASFFGKFTSYVPISARCMELWNAEFHIPSGVTHSFNNAYHSRCNVRFGRLSGEGTLYVKGYADTRPSYVFLGQDDAPDADFAGTLSLVYANQQQAYPQLVKIGGNAQRISGGANTLWGNVIVRAGSLLAGADSNGTAGAGAFGAAKIFVGDEGTPDGASPAFLADGAFTVANEIRVADVSPASATPVLGGTANADGAVFSGPVTLRRDVAFMAGEGATVEFTGAISGLQGVSKLGGGRVVIAGDVALGGDYSWSGGTLEATGGVVIPSGATLMVDESLCTRENFDKTFVLLKAANGISGDFASSPALPSGWKISKGESSVRLSHSLGFLIICR